MANRKTKLALLINIIAPYRLPIYSVLADHFDFLLLYGGTEANRDTWGNFEDALPNAKVVRAWGWQIRRRMKVNGTLYDQKFVHITPGLAWHLLLFKPDVVISNEMGFRSMIALAYGMVFRRPVWICWEGTLHSERSIGFVKKMIRKVFALCVQHWVAYGDTSTAYLRSLGVKQERILQSQNAVDEEQFKADVQPAWVIQPRPVVLHVGQFIERKGIGLLLEAAANLQRCGLEFALVLVGSGPNKLAIQERAEALGLKNIYFHPAQPQDKMPSVYRSADFLVFPTLEDVWGLVANEAVLSGIPVLCSKYAGCALELFTPENIFAPDDLSEFSRKLRDAISGRLSAPDATRLKSIRQLAAELVQAVNPFAPHQAD